MRKAKHLLMAAVVGVSTLMVGATPRPAVAETTTAVKAAVLADGLYAIVDSNGNVVGYIWVKDGEIRAWGQVAS